MAYADWLRGMMGGGGLQQAAPQQGPALPGTPAPDKLDVIKALIAQHAPSLAADASGGMVASLQNPEPQSTTNTFAPDHLALLKLAAAAGAQAGAKESAGMTPIVNPSPIVNANPGQIPSGQVAPYAGTSPFEMARAGQAFSKAATVDAQTSADQEAAYKKAALDNAMAAQSVVASNENPVLPPMTNEQVREHAKIIAGLAGVQGGDNSIFDAPIRAANDPVGTAKTVAGDTINVLQAPQKFVDRKEATAKYKLAKQVVDGSISKDDALKITEDQSWGSDVVENAPKYVNAYENGWNEYQPYAGSDSGDPRNFARLPVLKKHVDPGPDAILAMDEHSRGFFGNLIHQTISDPVAWAGAALGPVGELARGVEAGSEAGPIAGGIAKTVNFAGDLLGGANRAMQLPEDAFKAVVGGAKWGALNIPWVGEHISAPLGAFATDLGDQAARRVYQSKVAQAIMDAVRTQNETASEATADAVKTVNDQVDAAGGWSKVDTSGAWTGPDYVAQGAPDLDAYMASGKTTAQWSSDLEAWMEANPDKVAYANAHPVSTAKAPAGTGETIDAGAAATAPEPAAAAAPPTAPAAAETGTGLGGDIGAPATTPPAETTVPGAGTTGATPPDVAGGTPPTAPETATPATGATKTDPRVADGQRYWTAADIHAEGVTNEGDAALEASRRNAASGINTKKWTEAEVAATTDLTGPDAAAEAARRNALADDAIASAPPAAAPSAPPEASAVAVTPPETAAPVQSNRTLGDVLGAAPGEPPAAAPLPGPLDQPIAPTPLENVGVESAPSEVLNPTNQVDRVGQYTVHQTDAGTYEILDGNGDVVSAHGYTAPDSKRLVQMKEFRSAQDAISAARRLTPDLKWMNPAESERNPAAEALYRSNPEAAAQFRPAYEAMAREHVVAQDALDQTAKRLSGTNLLANREQKVFNEVEARAKTADLYRTHIGSEPTPASARYEASFPEGIVPSDGKWTPEAQQAFTDRVRGIVEANDDTTAVGRAIDAGSRNQTRDEFSAVVERALGRDPVAARTVIQGFENADSPWMKAMGRKLTTDREALYGLEHETLLPPDINWGTDAPGTGRNRVNNTMERVFATKPEALQGLRDTAVNTPDDALSQRIRAAFHGARPTSPEIRKMGSGILDERVQQFGARALASPEESSLHQAIGELADGSRTITGIDRPAGSSDFTVKYSDGSQRVVNAGGPRNASRDATFLDHLNTAMDAPDFTPDTANQMVQDFWEKRFAAPKDNLDFTTHAADAQKLIDIQASRPESYSLAEMPPKAKSFAALNDRMDQFYADWKPRPTRAGAPVDLSGPAPWEADAAAAAKPAIAPSSPEAHNPFSKTEAPNIGTGQDEASLLRFRDTTTGQTKFAPDDLPPAPETAAAPEKRVLETPGATRTGATEPPLGGRLFGDAPLPETPPLEAPGRTPAARVTAEGTPPEPLVAPGLHHISSEPDVWQGENARAPKTLRDTWQRAKRAATVQEGKAEFEKAAEDLFGPRRLADASGGKYVAGWTQYDNNARLFEKDWLNYRGGDANLYPGLGKPTMTSETPTIGYSEALPGPTMKGWEEPLRSESDIDFLQRKGAFGNTDERRKLLEEEKSFGGDWKRNKETKQRELVGATTDTPWNRFKEGIQSGLSEEDAIKRATDFSPLERKARGPIGNALHQINSFAREHKMFGWLNAPRGILADWLGDTFGQATSGNLDVIGEASHLPTIRATFSDIKNETAKAFETTPTGELTNNLGITMRGELTPGGVFDLRSETATVSDSFTGSRAVQRLGVSKRWADIVTKPLADRNAMMFREARDLVARWALYGSEVARELPAERDAFFDEIRQIAGKNGGDAEGMITQLGDQFSSRDVRRVAKDYGFDTGQGERMTRDWQGAVNRLDEAGFAEQKRVAFDFNATKADEALKQVFMFHTWQTRAAPFYLQNALRNPGLMNGYLHAMHDLKVSCSERVSSTCGYIDLWNTAAGYAIYMSPLAMFSSAILNLDPSFSPTDATVIDRVLGMVPAQVNPALQGILSGLALSGKVAPDWLSTETDRQLIGGIVNYGMAHGWFGKSMEGKLGDAFYQKALQLPEMIFAHAERSAGLGKITLPAMTIPLPGGADIKIKSRTVLNPNFTMANPHAGDNALIQDRIRDLVFTQFNVPAGVSRDQLLSLYPDAYEAMFGKDGAITDYIAGKPNDIVDHAVKDYTSGYLIKAAVRAGFQGGSTLRSNTQDALTMSRDNAKAAVNAPATSQFQSAVAMPTQGSSESNKLNYEATIVKEAGPQRGRDLVKQYDDFVYGSYQNPTPLDRVPEQQQIADAWVAKLSPADQAAYAAAKADRKAAIAANPEYAAYQTWADGIRSMSDEQFNAAVQNNDNFRRYLQDKVDYANAHLKPGDPPDTLRDEATSTDAYLAYHGHQTNVYDAAPMSTNNSSVPVEPAVITGAATAGSGGGAGSSDPATQLAKDAASYQKEMQQYQLALISYTGNPNANLADMNPTLRTAVKAQLADMGISAPSMPPALSRYQAWGSLMSSQGQPTDVATYENWKASVDLAMTGTGFTSDDLLDAAANGTLAQYSIDLPIAPVSGSGQPDYSTAYGAAQIQQTP